MTLTGKQQDYLQEIAKDCVIFEEKMSKYSTIKIGGLVDALVSPKNIDMLKSIMTWAKQERIPYLFLGAASNTLIRDGGFRGMIIRLKKGFDQLEVINETDEEVCLSVQAGLSTATLVQFAAENGFSGLEFLAGMPGNVGGNVLTNAGTNQASIADVLEEISVVDRSAKEMTIKRKGLDISYRNLKLPRSTAVVKAVFRLKKSSPEQVKKQVEDLIEKRKQTQPWGQLSLGCVFKNPAAGKGKKNISAGKLIDELGLKQVRVGQARVSEKHANFIINEGTATARDVEILMGLLKEKVKQHFGLTLEPEIRIIGEA